MHCETDPIIEAPWASNPQNNPQPKRDAARTETSMSFSSSLTGEGVEEPTAYTEVGCSIEWIEARDEWDKLTLYFYEWGSAVFLLFRLIKCIVCYF